LSNENPVAVFFLDCVGEDDLENMEYLSSIHRGSLKSGIPRVTPKVLSEVTTGKNPTENGILCPTRLGKDNLVRPLCKTIFEELSEEGRVLNYEIPFTMNQQGMFLTNVGSAPQVVEQQRPAALAMPRAGNRMWDSDKDGGELDEESKERALQGNVDYVRTVMATMRNLARNGAFDVFFVTIRNLDSFGHFLYKDQRARLAKYLDMELREWKMMGDMEGNIFCFSDHGIREKEETFFINKWLEEKGYLNVDVHERKLEKQREQDDQADENLTQVSVHSPFIELSKDTQAVSPDSYDSGVKILDDSLSTDDLRDELMGTGFYNDVSTPSELYGNGSHNNDTLGVDLVCDRADGVLVTGNLHPRLDGITDSEINCLCQGKIRSGVHTREGIIASNDPILNDMNLEPTELHSVIKKFVRRNAPKPSAEQLYGTSEMAKREEEIKGRLQDLGYI